MGHGANFACETRNHGWHEQSPITLLALLLDAFHANSCQALLLNSNALNENMLILFPLKNIGDLKVQMYFLGNEMGPKKDGLNVQARRFIWPARSTRC